MRVWLFVAVLAIVSATAIAQRSTEPGAPDAVKADPAHYKVEAENDAVRVLRIKYGPGEKSVMHRHPAGCAVMIGNSSFTFHLPDGKTQEAGGKAGEVQCNDATVHLPENTGKTAAEVVLVEFKNRRTFKK